MVITRTQKGFEIRFEYNFAMLYAVKAIPGAWFHSKQRCWYIRKEHDDAVRNLAIRFKVRIQEHEEDPADQFGQVDPLPELDVELSLRRTPFPFQNNGIAYNRLHERVLIGDEPGLGKTTQAIATVISLDLKPGLIICPTTLKLNWQKEWMDVAGRRSMILDDNVKNTWYRYYTAGYIDVFIVNYESLRKYFVVPGWEKPKRFKASDIPFRDVVKVFQYVIVDESHKCRNEEAQWSKFTLGMTTGKKYVFCLSGTPVVNRPKDLMPQLAILGQLKHVVSHIPFPVDDKGKPYDGNGRLRFLDRYCEGGSGASHLKELNYRLNKICFYRREKRDVLKDLPAKMRQVILCEISNRDEYDLAEADFKRLLKEAKNCADPVQKRKLRGIALVRIGQLKEISARGKLDTVFQTISEVLDADKKVVVFAHLKEIVKAIVHEFPGAVTITGDDSIEARHRSVTSFQNNPKVKLIVLSLGAGAEGINLTASSRVFFVEFPWNDAKCVQCEDRTDRIGQTEPVTAGYFLGEKTIDRYCYDIIQKKKDIFKEVTGDTNEVQEEVIDQLYNLFNQEA
jgi:SWI/SNF-related matrix-associated actin-dependent regulator 1 of chromatin subfamily A